MNKAKKVVIGALISVVTLGGLISVAYSGDHCNRLGMKGDKMAFMVNRIASKLDLDDDQKQKLMALKTTIQEQKKAHKESGQHDTLMSLLSEPELDEARALSLMQQRMDKFQLSAPVVIAAIANFTNSLNPEQREKVKTFASRMGKRGFGHSRGKGRHQE